MTTTNAKYAVIGGQYEAAFCGCTDTLLKAKRLATANAEHWDNWQGWHKPQIYKIEDTEEIETGGMITYRDGMTIRIPIYGAPHWAWDNDTEKWEYCEEEH